MVLRKTTQTSTQQKVSGTEFLIVRKDSGHIRTEVVVRLHVQSVGKQSDLRLRLPPLARLSVFVNKLPSYPQKDENEYTIPLDASSESNIVDLHFLHLDTAISTANISLPMIECPEAGSQRIVALAILPTDMRPQPPPSPGSFSIQAPEEFGQILNLSLIHI